MTLVNKSSLSTLIKGFKDDIQTYRNEQLHKMFKQSQSVDENGGIKYKIDVDYSLVPYDPKIYNRPYSNTNTVTMAGRQSGKTVSQAWFDEYPIEHSKTEPMLKPIDTAPNDEDIMLYCPDETPQLIAARWEFYQDGDDIVWEGWRYVDPILADLFPDGPQGVTHWMKIPKLEKPKKASENSDYRRIKEFTAEQMRELDKRRISPITVEIYWLRRAETPEVSPYIGLFEDEVVKIDDMKVDIVEYPCPIISRNMAAYSVTIITPEGELMTVGA